MGLKDKASKIDFTALPQLSAQNAPSDSRINEGAVPADDKRSPKTAPGMMMEYAGNQRSSLVVENERLAAIAANAGAVEDQLTSALGELRQWDGAKATRSIDPNLVDRSKFANRHEVNFSGPEFEELKSEIKDAGGNVQPIKVRMVKSASGSVRYEIVYGHRRAEACKQLGIMVNALIDNVDDKSMFVEMDRENRSRKDLSPWEQGQMYRRALSEGLFSSNKKLAEAVGADLGSVGRVIALADLPAAVVEAFNSPLDLQSKWAKPLREALEADEASVFASAAQLLSLKTTLSPKEILARLTGRSLPAVDQPAPVLAEVSIAGKKMATVKIGADGEASVVFETGAVMPHQIEALQKHMQVFFGGAKR